MSEAGASLVDTKLGLNVVPKTKVRHKFLNMVFFKKNDFLFLCVLIHIHKNPKLLKLFIYIVY